MLAVCVSYCIHAMQNIRLMVKYPTDYPDRCLATSENACTIRGSV